MKEKGNLVRCNVNIPKELLEKVEDIGSMKGLNRTQVFIVALTNFVDQRETFEFLPRIISYLKREEEKEIDDLVDKKSKKSNRLS